MPVTGVQPCAAWTVEVILRSAPRPTRAVPRRRRSRRRARDGPLELRRCPPAFRRHPMARRRGLRASPPRRLRRRRTELGPGRPRPADVDGQPGRWAQRVLVEVVFPKPRTGTARGPSCPCNTLVVRRCLSSRLVAVLVGLAVAGCGSSSSAGAGSTPAQVSATEGSLRAAGWQVHQVAGMPHTVSGAPQVGYLQVTSPAGAQLDLQVFAAAAQASTEAAAAQAKLPGFHASPIGDLIAFSRGNGRQSLTVAELSALRSALH